MVTGRGEYGIHVHSCRSKPNVVQDERKGVVKGHDLQQCSVGPSAGHSTLHRDPRLTHSLTQYPTDSPVHHEIELMCLIAAQHTDDGSGAVRWLDGGEVGIRVVIPLDLSAPAVKINVEQARNRVGRARGGVSVRDRLPLRMGRVGDPVHADRSLVDEFCQNGARVVEPPATTRAIELLGRDEISQSPALGFRGRRSEQRG